MNLSDAIFVFAFFFAVSVANTVKRALLIWVSILLFGNPVTLWSGVGTLAVTGGVLFYNQARQWDVQRMQRLFDQHPPKIALWSNTDAAFLPKKLMNYLGLCNKSDLTACLTEESSYSFFLGQWIQLQSN